MLTTSTEDERREQILVAGRIRAQRSRDRRKARRALERSNTEDGLIEAAIVRALLHIAGLSVEEAAVRRDAVASVLRRATRDCEALGISDAVTKIRARTMFLSGQPDTPPASRTPDTPVTSAVRCENRTDRIADPEQIEARS